MRGYRGTNCDIAPRDELRRLAGQAVNGKSYRAADVELESGNLQFYPEVELLKQDPRFELLRESHLEAVKRSINGWYDKYYYYGDRSMDDTYQQPPRVWKHKCSENSGRVFLLDYGWQSCTFCGMQRNDETQGE